MVMTELFGKGCKMMNKIKKTIQLQPISRRVAGEISGHKYKNHKTKLAGTEFQSLKTNKNRFPSNSKCICF
jgi:hypothetical protein